MRLRPQGKRCCGVERGPSEESLARAFLAHASREAAWELRNVPDAELGELFDELWELPAVDLSLQVELPKLLSPQLGRLCDAVADDDPDSELLDSVASVIDAPAERARLARAVIARAEAGALDGRLANAALVDLASVRGGCCAPACWRLLPCAWASPGPPAGVLLAA